MADHIQYCRYCFFCVVTPDNDCWCEKLDKHVIEKTAKAKNNCKAYKHVPFDAYNPTKVYRPDQKKPAKIQLNIFEENK